MSDDDCCGDTGDCCDDGGGCDDTGDKCEGTEGICEQTGSVSVDSVPSVDNTPCEATTTFEENTVSNSVNISIDQPHETYQPKYSSSFDNSAPCVDTAPCEMTTFYEQTSFSNSVNICMDDSYEISNGFLRRRPSYEPVYLSSSRRTAYLPTDPNERVFIIVAVIILVLITCKLNTQIMRQHF